MLISNTKVIREYLEGQEDYFDQVAMTADEQKETSKPSLVPLINESIFTTGFLGDLDSPEKNTQKSPEILKQHLDAIQAIVQTRFPPEPNGYLHIGHAKALLINFGYAKLHKGRCYLRFDDTNPEAERQIYADNIISIVKWLGFEPYKITYSSDYFQELYELALRLIQKGLAYVDHSTDEELKIQRGGENHGPRIASKYRSRTVEENLAEFQKMKEGFYEPREAYLRMKQDLSSGNPQMWDLIAYRILKAPHYRTGDAWFIYPTYDFTHCIVDSLENITHSLCTTEFVQSRESYNWLCHALDIYCPPQREYGRLNLEGTVLSKRKILKLVEHGIVHDWDDPRLYTLVGLRRRGVPPGAILYFVSTLGVSDSVSTIAFHRFEQSVRLFLENSVPRLMMIMDPIRVVLDNVPDDFCEKIIVPFHPKNPDMGSHEIVLTKNLFIEREDFRLLDSKDFFRLTPQKHVGLFKAQYPISYLSHTMDDSTGKITELRVLYMKDVTPLKKPKAFIQWVADSEAHNSPVKISCVREFSHLLKEKCESSDIIDQINPNSENVTTTALIETGLWEVQSRGPWPRVPSEYGVEDKMDPHSTRFQAMRIGYYALDKDTRDDKIILNRIVTLKEDKNK